MFRRLTFLLTQCTSNVALKLMYSIHLALNCRHLTTDTVCLVSVRPIINLYTVSQKSIPDIFENQIIKFD